MHIALEYSHGKGKGSYKGTFTREMERKGHIEKKIN